MMNALEKEKQAKGAPISTGQGEPLLEIKDLKVSFPSLGGTINAVRGVSLKMLPGESVAILGESGSGKSVTGRAVMGLIASPPARISGTIRFMGQEIIGRSDAQMRSIRGSGVAMVFQDALDGLNPVYSIGAQLCELLRVRKGLSHAEAREGAISLLEQVGIPSARDRVSDYPHQFSGGMRQRVCIALAIALKPRLLIADEPTTALDVTVQAGILRLIRRLQAESGMGLIFVTHDLSVARSVAQRLIVMYAGEVMEEGPIEEIFERPAHPYTRALLSSHPSAAEHWSELEPISGSPPDKSEKLAGCPFHPRCPMARERCRTEEPGLRAVTPVRTSRCHYFEELVHG